MKKYGIFEPGNTSQGKSSFDQYLNNLSFQQAKNHFGTFSGRIKRMSQSDKHFFTNSEENCGANFVCKYDRCGRKFESEARLRDHQLRIHEKNSNHNISNISQSLSNSSIKLPQIQTQSTSSQQPTKTRNANGDDLHPVIRQAQQMASNITSSSGSLSSSKKLTSSQTTKINSRPSSSSSSTFNTTSSSTNNIDFANIKNSFLSSPTKNLVSAKRMEAISHIKSHEKDVQEPKFIKNATSEQQLSNHRQTNSSSNCSSAFSSASAKTKEEILFGKKQISNTIKQSGNNSQIKLPIDNQKLDNIKEKQISKECLNKESSDEEESDKDEELEKEDQILQINFSEDDEENEEEDSAEPKQKGQAQSIEKNQQEQALERSQNEESTQKILSEQFILEYTGCSALSEITELILRNKNLLFLDDTDQLDWSEMSQLNFLSICHNPRMSSIQALNSIPNMCLLEISLEYNAISNITAIFRHTQVQKLFLSGNKIESISGIEALCQIKTLSLMKNKIKGLTTTIEALSSLPLLEELDLEQNPVSSRFNYKYDILWKLKLKKLDGDIVTDMDLELSKTFQSEYLQFCRENQQKMSNSQQIMRPSTAKPSSIVSQNNNSQQQSYKGRFKAKLGELVEQSKVVLGSIPEEKQWELETEIELAKQQERELQQELMVLQLEGNENKQKCDKLVSQNCEFQSSLTEYKDALRQQTQLQSKYKQYVQLLNSNSSEAAKFIKAIFKLNLKLEELNSEQSYYEKEQQEITENKQQLDGNNFFGVPGTSQIKQAQESTNALVYDRTQSDRRVMMYDDAEELKDSDDEAASANMGRQIQKEKLANEIKVPGDIEEPNDSSNEESNEDGINLDIGFDSDDLDEETKEIKELLQQNSKALEDVKRELNGL